MIRLALLWTFIAAVVAYAWRDWFKSLCGIVLMVAVVQHPDMPKTMLGIQGLNPWNAAFALVGLAWLVTRGREGNAWDMPKGLTFLLGVYFALVFMSAFRLMGNIDVLQQHEAALGELVLSSNLSVVSEHIINCIKWIVPGILIFDGARTESRQRLAVFCMLGIYVLLAVQVIRWMPLAMLGSGDDLEERALKVLSNEVGFHRVNLSMMLAGAFWAIIAARPLFKSKLLYWGMTGTAFVVLFGQALTGGRAGYVTWALVGLTMAALRWRRYLVIGPAFALGVVLLVPAARDRLMQGFTPDSVDTNTQIDSTFDDRGGGPHWYTVTSGRVIAWPLVFEKIAEQPLTGYGRESMKVTGLWSELWFEYGEAFPHPHNIYLEFILDNGLPAFFIVLLFYLISVRYSARLFVDKENPIHAAVGGVCLALILALLFAGIGSQTFYPREGSVGMWCAIGLMFRVYLQRQESPAQQAAHSRSNSKRREPWRRQPGLPVA